MPSNNEDSLIGQNVGKQGFSISGTQFGIPGTPEGGKTPTTAAPMAINNQHAGQFADEDAVWRTTFGASLDSYLSLFNGTFLQRSIDEMDATFIAAGGGIFKEAMANAADDNLYDKINGVQQIQYVASKTTAEEGADSLDDFGGISEARSLGMRLPIMAAGWGRKISLLPTDPSPTNDPNSRVNDPAHKLDRASWKHGPVDLRWDPKRGVWSAFNDMIADHNEVGIGTWMHGTNSLAEGGFPFVRGRLEDIIWVRRTKDTEDGDALSDNDATAKAMIHLEARFFDEQENGSAPLSSIFCVPHRTTSDFHGSRPESNLGEEITGEDARIDIKTRVHFINPEDTRMDGPIFFNQSSPIIEENYGNEAHYLWRAEEANEILGSMRFDRTSGVWLPSIPIEECELVGNHFKGLIENDARVAVESARVLKKLNEWTENTKNTMSAYLGVALASDTCGWSQIENWTQSAGSAVSNLSSEANGALTELASEVESAMNEAFAEFAAAISAALLECCGSVQITPPNITINSGHDISVTLSPLDISCSVGTIPGPPAFAEEFNVHLNGPCALQPDYIVGTTQMNPNIQTDKGLAQLENRRDGVQTLILANRNDGPETELSNPLAAEEKLSTTLVAGTV